MRIAAIDQGTTSTRVLVAGTDGSLRIAHSLRHAQHFPYPGWVEHDAHELLRNVAACIDAAGDVDAIGIDNQGESCLAWDAVSGEPLSPVIVWQDNRTKDVIERLRAGGAEAVTLARAGLPLDPYFSASKLAWIIDNVPAVRAAQAAGRLRLGTTDAFFLDRLTGRFVTDATTASRTSLMNLETMGWDEELCRLFGVPIDALPEIGPSAGLVIGMAGKTPVTASIVDQQAALYGHGCREAGDAKITFGTGAFALAVTGSRIVRNPEIGLLPTVAWQTPHETVYAVDGGVYDAGSAVEWLGRIGLMNGVDELQTFTDAPAIDRGLVFVPALSGLACPYWDRSAASLWLGMSSDTTRQQMCQSALEGVALATVEVIGAMAREVAVAQNLSIDGGLSRSPYFSQFLADALGRNISTRSFDELTSLGCAALAALAVGTELPAIAKGDVEYRARDVDRQAWRQRFNQAVGHSRGWR
ncbi:MULTISPECIES: FGGY family carbohydrate kinase [Phyllobacteriaceae]|jgi:glycerol kinase|uniref:ATP:glycerol 3-phosphotransferase n=1 Tax=Mesorhizobium hungaricum TaxID=1566387 RepID=A0A1C2EDY0_9HYPH|nr:MULTISPECIES: FGGY family carbohydrate kinase [Mesorhizobium]MBN9237829.1 glycerol kinase [Mesorhizobium sp.]MDQ0329495.1 glycerol kinase [Mesorhizobium sp. YL-MeA3-2017]OCX25186.1 glycerol kinase [Mesorhizobium hungaricum]